MPDGHRWSGYSHEELYQKINSGPGPQASHASVERWEGVSSALTEINAELLAGVARSGAHWEGSAADQARAGISPLAAWAEDARAGAEVMRVSAELQADFIAKARADMPPPVKVTAEDPGALVSTLTHLVGGQTDYELQEKAHNAAEQRAREVMTTYASSTTTNTSTLGQFHQPPQLVINATEVVRNEAPGVGAAVPGHGYHGPHGGRGGRWGRGGGRGGRGSGVVPAPRPAVGARPPASGGPSTSTSSAGTPQGAAPGTAQGTTRTANGVPTPSGGSGGGGGTFAPGVVGGQRSAQDRRKSEAATSQEHTSQERTSAEHTSAAAQPGQSTATAPGHSSGTTSISSTEFGAIATAANAQHASAVGPGGASGALPGATQSGGDTVHKRTVQAAPQQPAFDPFGGVGARQAEEEEDIFHDAADYLRETDDIYGIGGMISPPVIGESQSR